MTGRKIGQKQEGRKQLRDYINYRFPHISKKRAHYIVGAILEFIVEEVYKKDDYLLIPNFGVFYNRLYEEHIIYSGLMDCMTVIEERLFPRFYPSLVLSEQVNYLAPHSEPFDPEDIRVLEPYSPVPKDWRWVDDILDPDISEFGDDVDDEDLFWGD